MSLLSLFIIVCVLNYNGVEGRRSFKTIHGDVYDCIDFYKQPSFNHPMLRNHSFHPQMRPSFLVKAAKEDTLMEKPKLKSEGCLEGTVPIRRNTKDSSKMESHVVIHEPSGTYVAGVRRKPGSGRYTGGGMMTSVYNPRVRPSAYSQARLKISSGSDAIQVGWRVDPSLRGDNRTRLFIYTEAGQSHCFDAKCGFVLTNIGYPLDHVLEPASQPGDIYVVRYNITRDPQSGNWWLHESHVGEIGFWPKTIFTGLADLATDIEWAGEVYSPPGVYEPAMGSGYKPDIGTTLYVAYFAFLTIVNENYTREDATNMEEFATDRSLYDVHDEGNVGPAFKHLVFFGGARY